MKKLISFLLCFCLLLLCSACIPEEDSAEGSLRFFYLHSELTYGNADSVIAAEEYTPAAEPPDLDALLEQYLSGPAREDLRSPFPVGCAVAAYQFSDGVLTLRMNDAYSSLSGVSLTQACSCLAMTVFALTDAHTASIQAENGSPIMDLTRDSLILQDLPPEIPTTEENT